MLKTIFILQMSAIAEELKSIINIVMKSEDLLRQPTETSCHDYMLILVNLCDQSAATITCWYWWTCGNNHLAGSYADIGDPV